MGRERDDYQRGVALIISQAGASDRQLWEQVYKEVGLKVEDATLHVSWNKGTVHYTERDNDTSTD